MNDEDWEEDEQADEWEEGSPRRAKAARDPRGNWYLLTGLIIGLALGLLVAWVISPVQYTDIEPKLLSGVEKDVYRQTIARAYAADHDLARARQRLQLIETGDLMQPVAAQAQRLVAEKQSADDARVLAQLASDLGNPPVALILSATPPPAEQPTRTATQAPVTPVTDSATLESIQTPTAVVTPAPTRTPQPTFTPRPTATPLPVLDAPFILKTKQEVCGASAQAGLLQIQVNDAKGEPLAGVKIVAAWKDGESTFYTGLAPEINRGYADFVMSPSLAYSLRVGEVSEPVNNLQIGTCDGGWSVTFEEGQ